MSAASPAGHGRTPHGPAAGQAPHGPAAGSSPAAGDGPVAGVTDPAGASVSTHVLDTSRGHPAAGVAVALSARPAPGDGAAFFPEVAVVFAVTAGEHHHVPLLLNPFGYSVYRGS